MNASRLRPVAPFVVQTWPLWPIVLADKTTSHAQTNTDTVLVMNVYNT